jgi:hypothetical protein
LSLLQPCASPTANKAARGINTTARRNKFMV